MVNPATMSTATEFGTALSACGIDSWPAESAPSWPYWNREWDGTVPISRYLPITPAGAADFFIVAADGAFNVFVLDVQDLWFICVAVHAGAATCEELISLVQAAEAEAERFYTAKAELLKEQWQDRQK